MKTNKRRLLAALTATTLALTPCFAAGTMTAFAEDTYTISVNSSDSNAAANGYSYTAYQIFKGDISGTTEPFTLSNIDWADDFNNTGFLSALAADTTLRTSGTPDFNTGMTVDDVIAKLKSYDGNNPKLAAFAKAAKANVGSAYHATSTDGTSGVYPISVNKGGYYLIEETKVSNADSSGKNEVYSRFMLEVAGNASATVKRVLPSLTKEIVGPNANDDKDANTASVGDVVEYKLDSAVPDMTGYNKYFFVVNDTMENGLTFNPASVRVKIGTGDSYLPSDAYEVQTGANAKVGDTQYTFQIVLKNFIQYNTPTYIGQPIEITYNATVNNAATAGTTTDSANENTVNLTYSNNPNVNSNGGNEGQPDGPDEPSGTDPKGETTPDKTYTYLTELEIEKVDKANHATKLRGAKFELTGESLQAVYHEQGIFKKDAAAAPAYYLLTDGTYSQTAPTSETASNYVDGMAAVKYALVTSSDTSYNSMNKVNAFGETDNNGKVTFGKIGVGTYKIVETKEPAGYNKLTAPVVITITAEPSADGCIWSYQRDSVAATNSNSFMIENAQGSTLPSTGGVGTKLFYLFGSAFVIGASTFIVTKKRVGTNK